MSIPKAPYLDLGLEPVAQKAIAEVLAGCGRRVPPTMYNRFSVEQFVLFEVQDVAQEILPGLLADHLMTALGNGPKSQRELALETARARDQIAEATRRGRSLYAQEELRPRILLLAEGLKDYSIRLPDDTTQMNAARAWDRLWGYDGPITKLTGLANSHPEGQSAAAGGPIPRHAALPKMKRGSLASVLESSRLAFEVAQKELRSLALGPLPVDPGDAQTMSDELIRIWAYVISHVRGLARALEREREKIRTHNRPKKLVSQIKKAS